MHFITARMLLDIGTTLLKSFRIASQWSTDGGMVGGDAACKDTMVPLCTLERSLWRSLKQIIMFYKRQVHIDVLYTELYKVRHIRDFGLIFKTFSIRIMIRHQYQH